MKKLALSLAVLFSVAMVSCGGNKEESKCDSPCDSPVEMPADAPETNDSLAADSTAANADSTAVNAEEAPAEAQNAEQK